MTEFSRTVAALLMEGASFVGDVNGHRQSVLLKLCYNQAKLVGVSIFVIKGCGAVWSD